MNINDDIYFLKLAIELAKENVKNGGGPFEQLLLKMAKSLLKVLIELLLIMILQLMPKL